MSLWVVDYMSEIHFKITVSWIPYPHPCIDDGENCQNSTRYMPIWDDYIPNILKFTIYGRPTPLH